MADAAARGYNVAQQWEHSAALSALQARAVAEVARHTAERPLPSHVRPSRARGGPGGPGANQADRRLNKLQPGASCADTD
jgi:hypothetical protein